MQAEWSKIQVWRILKVFCIFVNYYFFLFGSQHTHPYAYIFIYEKLTSFLHFLTSNLKIMQDVNAAIEIVLLLSHLQINGYYVIFSFPFPCNSKFQIWLQRNKVCFVFVFGVHLVFCTNELSNSYNCSLLSCSLPPALCCGAARSPLLPFSLTQLDVQWKRSTVSEIMKLQSK